jgi:hypothetical protein
MDYQNAKPLYKETYGRLKKMIKGKANSELKASKNPKKFMEENKEPSIKGLKGIAF